MCTVHMTSTVFLDSNVVHYSILKILVIIYNLSFCPSDVSTCETLNVNVVIMLQDYKVQSHGDKPLALKVKSIKNFNM